MWVLPISVCVFLFCFVFFLAVITVALFQIFNSKEELIDPMKQYNLMTVAEFQEQIGSQVRCSFYLIPSHHTS